MKYPLVHAYTKRIFNRFYIRKAYPNYFLLSGFKENWVYHFPDIENRYDYLSPNSIRSGKDDHLITKNIFDQPEWKRLKEKLDIKRLLVYKPFKGIRKIEQEQNIKILCNSFDLFSLLENKVAFRKNFSDILPFPPYQFSSTPELKKSNQYKKLREKYGKFVLQDEILSGGRGTYLIDSTQDYNNALQQLPKDGRVVISKYIAGEAASVQACIYHNQIIDTGLQKQLVGLPSLTNCQSQFVGGQWVSDDYSAKNHQQVNTIVQQTGQELIKLGYQGIFGLDIIVEKDTKKIYILEMNARMTGLTPIINMIQTYLEDTPLINYHILSFLPNLKEKLALDCQTPINQSDISYLILTNTNNDSVRLREKLLPGLYQYSAANNTIIHQRVTSSLAALKNKNQFLLLGIPNQDLKTPGNDKRLIRFIKKGAVLQSNSDVLNQTAQNITQLIRKKFKKV
jgi:hypothetical protein